MWPNTQVATDLVTFTEEILNGKLRYFCSEYCKVLAAGVVQNEHNCVQEVGDVTPVYFRTHAIFFYVFGSMFALRSLA